MRKSFREYLKKQKDLFLEMPHIPLDTSGQAIDLELEVHSNMRPKEYVKYFKDWIQGKTMKSKNPGFTQELSRKSQREFVDYILNQTNIVRLFTIKNYGEGVWSKIVRIMEKYL